MKYIARIPLKEIERVQLYVNTGKKTLAQIVRETGAAYALNGGVFDSRFRACCHLRADGYTWAEDAYSYYGYGWDTSDIRVMLSGEKDQVRNYICCVELIRDGKPVEPIYNADMGGVRGRSAMALTQSGELLLWCSRDGSVDAMTPEALRDKLLELGARSAILLDGGGSSQCDFAGEQITSSRVVQNLILVYLKKSAPGSDEGGKSMKIYLSPSSQPENLYAAGGTNEQVQCNRIAAAAKTALERCGFQVKKGPEGQGYKANVAESNAWGADLHIPIHTNAGGGRGPIVFVYSLTSVRKAMAQPVYDALNAVVPVASGYGVRANPGLYEAANTSAACVYCECAFHDNAEEAAWIIANADKLGEAIAKGVCKGVGVRYVEPEQSAPGSDVTCPHCGGKLKLTKED